MTIIVEKISANKGGILKAVETSFGSSFMMNDTTDVVVRRPLRPGLLTALLGGTINNVFGQTTSYAYDETTFGAVLPGGKSYTEYGPDAQKDIPRRLFWQIPSFGVTARVSPADWANRRQPGTNELMQEEDLVADMVIKIQEAYDLLDELAFAQLLVSGTNLTLGGPFEQYDYYQQIVGVARPAPVFVDLAGTPVTPIEVTIRDQVSLLQQELGRMRDRATAIVAVAGTDFFNARYELEKNVGLARPIMYGIDLASMPISQSTFGGNPAYYYQWFDSYDGVRYINYGSEIIDGTPLIPADQAILIPIGARNVIRVSHAPAQTRTYANTVAQEMYTWQKVDERTGLVMASESNKLFSLVNPRAIVVLTMTP